MGDGKSAVTKRIRFRSGEPTSRTKRARSSGSTVCRKEGGVERLFHRDDGHSADAVCAPILLSAVMHLVAQLEYARCVISTFFFLLSDKGVTVVRTCLSLFLQETESRDRCFHRTISILYVWSRKKGIGGKSKRRDSAESPLFLVRPADSSLSPVSDTRCEERGCAGLVRKEEEVDHHLKRDFTLAQHRRVFLDVRFVPSCRTPPLFFLFHPNERVDGGKKKVLVQQRRRGKR